MRHPSLLSLLFTAALPLGCGSSTKTPAPLAEEDAGDAGAGFSMGAEAGALDSAPPAPSGDDSGAGEASATCVNDPVCSGPHPGSQCSVGNIVTCAIGPGGCLVATTTACPTNEICASSGVVAACVCNDAPGCTQTGTYCEGANTLVTCMVDGNGCLTSTEKTCGAGQNCNGTQGCVCSLTECTAVGSSCTSATSILTCTKDADGCFLGISVPCPSMQTCSGSPPTAQCG